MKFIRSFLIAIFVLGAINQLLAQGESVDTRVDNMSYWKKMARKGLIPFTPYIPIAPSDYLGSQLQVDGIKTTDSPDIPVTNQSVTESENSVFIDPNNNQYILNSNNSTTWSGTTVQDLFGANYFYSQNAGITWGGSIQGAGSQNNGDPATAIGRNGRKYINYINSTYGQGVSFSDNGTAWTTAIVAPNPGNLADKNHLWIDNSPSSPHEGNLYVSWTDIGGLYDSELKISRSTDDGVTWSLPMIISAAVNAGSHNQGVNIQTGPNGEVYVVWAIYDSWPANETAIGFAKSLNGGENFSSSTRILSNIMGIRTTGVLKNMRVNSFPVMAVDISNGPNRGNIYIVWTNIGVPGTNTGTNKSVYFIRSTNGGSTWSTPMRINKGTFANGKEAYFPWISCDSETGTLSVIFYDDRNTASTACETWVAYSTDAGNTWTDFRISDVSFTPSPISGLAASYMGDYIGITSKGGRVYPCWTDTRGGLFMTYVSPFTVGVNAEFTADTRNVCAGSGVVFTDQSVGPPTSWNWTFQGGIPTTFSGKNPPPVIYPTPGTYSVTLTVSDNFNSDSETKSGFIRVENIFSEFSGSPSSFIVGDSVTFTDLSLCDPSSWSWNFPGGTPSTFIGQNPPPVVYDSIGAFDVTLTVTKETSSQTMSKSGYIQVKPPEYTMSDTILNTCHATFFDPGGASGDYVPNQDFTMVFNPCSPGNMIRCNFSSFSLESHSTCSYDYLKIYNGNNVSSALIGTFCGTGSPGMVTANNPSGAMTFVFHSDASVVSSGWVADVTNVAGVVLNPLTFLTIPASAVQVNLTWTPNPSNNNVLIAWSSNGTFGTPVSGSTYSSGSSIPGGGTVIYSGNAIAFTHSSLNTNTTYYYKAFSYDNDLVYSPGIASNATTPCGYLILPASESFAISTLPACWTTQISGSGAVNKWTISGTKKAGGSANEMKSSFQNVNPGITRLVTPALNTTGMTVLNLAFRHFLDGFGTGATLRVQSSTDRVNWTNEAWSVATSSSNIGPALVSTTVTANLNSENTYIAFTVEGNLYKYDYWYIDDISITGNPPTLTVAPQNRNVTSESGNTTFTVATTATWTATSNQLWCSVTPSGTGNGTITANYSSNVATTSRTAVVTVTVSGISPFSVTVTQAGAVPVLSVYPSSIEVLNNSGSSQFSVTSNTTWTATSNQDWCVVYSSGSGNGTIEAIYSDNTSPFPRSAEITVSATGITPVVLTLIQTGAPDRVLNLSLFFQGLYIGDGMMRPANDNYGPHWGSGIADIFSVELHSGSEYGNIVFSIDSIQLFTNGTASVIIPPGYNGNYFLTIRNRNCIETVSSGLISFNVPVINYSFNIPSKAYGANLGIMTDGWCVLYSGDVNQDYAIDGTDLSNIDNLNDLFAHGYLPEDVNGDGIIDATDLNITRDNNDHFIGAKTP